MGIYDNGGSDTGPTEMQTSRSFDTLVQYPDDRGLGNDKTFHTLIRFVATVYCELCPAK